MLNQFVKPLLFACLLASFIAGGIQAAVDPIAVAGLCGDDRSCYDNGCEGTGGVCGRVTAQGPCWCLY